MGLCRASTAHSGPLPGLRPSFLVRVPLVREKTIPPGERLLQDPTFFFGMSSPDGSICLKTSVFASFSPFSFPLLRDYSDRNGRRRLRESERGRHTSRHPSDSFFLHIPVRISPACPTSSPERRCSSRTFRYGYLVTT